MNYRHHFHAGNFADVMKHALLLQLLRGMQRKEKGFLYLDTHSGRGRYDLSDAAFGDSLARTPEHPDGIGRLLTAADLIAPLADYVTLVRAYDKEAGNRSPTLQFYPGSPCIAAAAARPQDRLALCEKQPQEAELLRDELRHLTRAMVHVLDGYSGIRAMIPPLEKRAFVLIDPPFEKQDEFARIVSSVHEGLRRMPAATFAIWYPLTERARIDEFFYQLTQVALPPTWTAEIQVAGESSSLKMRGCGLAVINPPWQIDQQIRPLLDALPALLGQDQDAATRLDWIVRE